MKKNNTADFTQFELFDEKQFPNIIICKIKE